MRRLSYLGAQFVVGENDLRGVARLSGHRLPAEALAIDGRVGRGSNIFSRFGGAVSMRLKSQLHTPQFAAYPLMKAWEQKRHELPGLNIDTRVHTRFQIAPVDLSWLTESLSHPDFDFDGSLYSQSTLNLVLLLNYFTFLLPATVDTYRQVASLGGVFADRSQFDEHLSIHWSEITSPYVGTRVESLLPKSPEDLVRQIVSIRGDPHIGLPPAPIVLEGDRVWIDGAWTVTHIARSRSEGESTRESQRRGKQFEMYVRRIVDTTAWRPDKLRGLVGKKIVKTDGSHLTDIDAIAENNEYVLLISCKSYRSADAVGEMDRASYMNRSSRVVDAIDKWCDVLDAIRSDHGDIVELVGRRKLVGCIVYPDLYYCLDPRALCEGAPGLPFVVSVGEFENYVTTGNVHGRLERH